MSDFFLVFVHSSPSSLSAGQIKFLALKFKYPAIRIVIKAKIDIITLYFEIVIKKGKNVSKLAKLAPAPSNTKTAGSAQQINVDVDANKEKKFIVLLFKIFFTYKLY